MKNKVLSLLSLAVVGTVLCACTKEQTLVYTRPFSRAEFKEEFKPKNSAVYMDENGQLIKINDPDDPTVNVVKELKMSDAVVSLYYSPEKKKEFAETKQLSVTGYPLKSSVGKVTWESSNPEVATVDENGLVTAVSEGVSIVTATSEAGLKTSSRIAVNNTYVLLSQAGKSAKKILETQKSSEFKAVDTVATTMEIVQTKSRDGVEINKSVATQKFWSSRSNSYFRIVSEDQDVLTSGGSIVPSYTDYIFYTTNDYLSYIFCNSDGKSTYVSLDQSYLVDEGKTPYQALGDVLQNFLVSGSSLMTDQFTNILGQSLLDNGYGGCTYKGSFGENSGEFAFVKITEDGGRVGAKDAEALGIPVGTVITIVDDIRYLWEDNLLESKSIVETIEYDLGGSHYVERYVGNYHYQGRNVELKWPVASDYSLVDSIFDL